MQNPKLEQQVKTATQQLALLLVKPSDKATYELIAKLALDISKDNRKKADIFIDTLAYSLMCQAEFIQTVAKLHPGSTEQQWFFNKVTQNLSYIDTMVSAAAVNNVELFNQTASQMIENNIAFEQLQMNLLLTRRRNLLADLSNVSYFYSTIDLLLSSLTVYSPVEQTVLDRLVFCLLALRKNPAHLEEVHDVWQHAITLTNPLISAEEKAESAELAIATLNKLAPEVSPSWQQEALDKAEYEETLLFLQKLAEGTTLNDREELLADGFLLFSTFKRRYTKEDSSYLALSSFAKACLLARNLAFILPPAKHKEALQAITQMGQGLRLFLENRYGTLDDTNKAQKIKEASMIMHDNYTLLIAMTDALAKRTQ